MKEPLEHIVSRAKWAALVVLGLLVLGWAAEGEQDPPERILAAYDGGSVTTAELESRLPPTLQVVEGPGATARIRQLLEDLVLNDLLYLAGKRQGFDRDPEIEARVAELRRRLVIQRLMGKFQDPQTVPREDVRTYYEGHAEQFWTTAVRLRQIRVSEEAGALGLLEQLHKDPQSFEKLASEHSESRNAATTGGELAWVVRGQLSPQVETAVFGLRTPGDISDILQTLAGYHIFQLIERQEGHQQPLDVVEDRIRAVLAQQRFQSKLEELKLRGRSSINEEALDTFIRSRTPRLQSETQSLE